MNTFKLASSLASLLATHLLISKPILLNGPMPGASTMESVTIWTQTSEPAEIYIEYWPKGDYSKTFESERYLTEADSANVAKIALTAGLEPSSKYEYSVFVDGEKQEPKFRPEYRSDETIPLEFQTKPRWRFIPSEDSQHSVFDFRIAAGACAYINEDGYDREGQKPYGDNYQIFESIYEKQPDLMLWLGDVVYYRENDFESRSGMQHRWTHDRATPELRPLLASAHHFAIWDDHDYGPNDIGRSYPLKGIAKETFDLFWANPSSGLPETPGIFTFLNWGDVNIFMLDNRSYLTTATARPDKFGEEKAMLGKGQVDWLINHLVWAQSQTEGEYASYPASFNLICVGNQVLSGSGNPHGYRNFKDEWQYLIDRIVEEGIGGVVFVTGDVHFAEANKLTYRGGGQPGTPGKAGIEGELYTLHELTTTPLTAGPSSRGGPNPYRFDLFDDPEVDSIVQRNFLVLDFKGPLDNRRMEARYFDSDGNLLNRKSGGGPDEITDASTFFANDLQAPQAKK